MDDPSTGVEALRDRARTLGVETSYWDVEGKYHEASVAALRVAVDVLEADRDVAGGPLPVEPVVVARPGTGPQRVMTPGVAAAELVLADGTALELTPADGHVELPAGLPPGCHALRWIDGSTHVDGTTIVAVAPWRMPRSDALAGGAGLFVPTYALWEHTSPLPSFAHLAALATRVAVLGIGVVSTLPLYAAFLDEPFDPSPYAPVSRLHWNEVYLDDATLPPAPVPTQGELIDWRELAHRRRLQLLDAATDLDPYLQAGIDRLVAARPDIAAYARFRAGRQEPTDAGRPAAVVERSHLLAQFLAHRQLATVEGPDRAVLALDLPIGSHPTGYETWAHGDLFASGMTVGAPPDEFFGDGQDWGFPPPLPGAGRRDGHAMWRRLVARAGEHASVLRIDHVMGVERLWWVPDGLGARDGVYVRYPREELLAVIAAEAAATGTTIVGEDLGTVPAEVIEALARWDVLGLYEEQFALHHHEHGLGAVPARSVAGIRTHDMPAFAAAFAAAPGAADGYRRLLETVLGREVADTAADVLDAALQRLARSDAYLVMADIDDLIGDTAPHNVPGQVLPSTWRRRLPQPTSGMLAAGDVRRRLEILRARPSSGKGAP